MTSTLMSTEPYFFEKETPHVGFNTMDVNVYSGWVYLVNWPELERLDMDMFFGCIPKKGPKKGLVWHSLWDDAASYVEEPTFITRVYRDALWFNDPAWSLTGFQHAVNAANRVYEDAGFENLIDSKHGNQSYDCWKMPGVSSYVNSAWIYGLYGLERMSLSLGQPIDIKGTPIAKFYPKAVETFNRLLWNESTKNWNLFYRTPEARQISIPECTFTDQLFGKWMLAIDPGAETVLPNAKVKSALGTLYSNNLVEDSGNSFRGWVNGMLPGRRYDPSGIHSRVCWFGAQFNLGSLLGLVGDEKASLDVFQSVEKSLHSNHFAAGEWNQGIDENLKVQTEPAEPAKDTPRFAPYPRYKSGWEFLIRLLGLQMDQKHLFLTPFKTLDFSLQSVQLAGCKLTVKVQCGWNRALLNGKPVNLPLKIDRSASSATVDFLR